MLQQVTSTLRERCHIESSGLLVVGVSGGPDSLCLLHVLHALGYPLVIAHVDHQLRPESAAEAAAVEEMATSLDLPFVLHRIDVRAHAMSNHLSIEEAARQVRYQFLFEQARLRGAQAVAVGHTADDQVETVLMHLIRGAGMAGLKGMSFRSLLPQFDLSIPLVRPLLDIWRSETVHYCRSNSLTPQRDPSNDSPEYFRNRIRNELLPLLESFNPRVREALWRTAEILASDLALLEGQVARAWQRTVTLQADGFVCFDAAELALQPAAVRRHLILMAFERLSPEGDIGFASLERSATFIDDTSASRLELGGGVWLTREAGGFYVSLGPESLPMGDWPQMLQDSISIPIRTPITQPLANGWQFTAKYESVTGFPLEFVTRGRDGFQVCLDADMLPQELALRPPRLGDRFQPLGLGGHSQKLSDFFVNAKLPARARGRWPILCSGNTLIWVPGFRPAEAFKIRDETRHAACFAVSRPGDASPGG